MLASESVALDSLSFRLVRDIAPGEAVFIDEGGRLHSQQCVASVRHTPCIFEYVYFARPDSKIDNISVYRARMRMGDRLAEKILRERANHDIDVVIPIPDTSRTSAQQLAQRLGLKYREGFIKNRYIGRTFIQPDQSMRSRGVELKFNPLPEVLEGRRVVVVDDSIVRGTTTKPIVDLLRKAGAREVHVRIHSPAMRHPCYLGVDTARRDDLIAHRMSVREICAHIGADSLGYLSLPGLLRTQ